MSGSTRRGFALPMTLFLISIVTLMLTAAFAKVQSDRRVAESSVLLLVRWPSESVPFICGQRLPVPPPPCISKTIFASPRGSPTVSELANGLWGQFL